MSGRRDSFSDCHPAVNFLYFAGVILFTMFVTHPVVLVMSFSGALCYAIRLKGWRKVLKNHVLLMLPFLVLVALINPLFNHYGVTVLYYLDTGPVTLEAVIYGVILAFVLFIAITWFVCFNMVMTTDKFVYLFGKLLPAISLLLSMVFRFVPKFRSHLKVVRNSQKAIGRDIGNGRFTARLKNTIAIFSIMITWALENAVETSDSMQARGHGLKGRTAFSIFRFDRRDLVVTILAGALVVIFVAGWTMGFAASQYNPYVKLGGFPLSAMSVLTFACWGLFCFFPVIMGVREDIVFARLQKKSTRGAKQLWYLNPAGAGPGAGGR